MLEGIKFVSIRLDYNNPIHTGSCGSLFDLLYGCITFAKILKLKLSEMKKCIDYFIG